MTARFGKSADEAEEYFKIATSAPDRGNASAHVDYCWFLFTRFRASEAEAQCKKALQLDENIKQARFNLSLMYYASERYDEACAMAEQTRNNGDTSNNISIGEYARNVCNRTLPRPD